MFHSKLKVAAAVLAFGALMIAPAVAGSSKNGGGGGPSKNGGGCGGNCGGGGGFNERIICVVNGRRFEVTDVRECYPKRKIYYHFERRVIFKHKVKQRRLPVCGCAYSQSSYGGGYASGYTSGRYYSGYATGGSVAARMQAERRAAVAMTDGGVYVGQDEGGYGQSRRLKKRRYYGGYEAGYTFDPGYVVHYGPTISKDGGY